MLHGYVAWTSENKEEPGVHFKSKDLCARESKVPRGPLDSWEGWMAMFLGIIWPSLFTIHQGEHYIVYLSLSVLRFCNKLAEAQKTLKHRSLYGSQFWLLGGPQSMVPVSWSGYPTSLQHGLEAGQKIGMCMEESHDKQGSQSPGRSQIHCL